MGSRHQYSGQDTGDNIMEVVDEVLDNIDVKEAEHLAEISEFLMENAKISGNTICFCQSGISMHSGSPMCRIIKPKFG